MRCLTQLFFKKWKLSFNCKLKKKYQHAPPPSPHAFTRCTSLLSRNSSTWAGSLPEDLLWVRGREKARPSPTNQKTAFPMPRPPTGDRQHVPPPTRRHLEVRSADARPPAVSVPAGRSRLSWGEALWPAEMRPPPPAPIRPRTGPPWGRTGRGR